MCVGVCFSPKSQSIEIEEERHKYLRGEVAAPAGGIRSITPADVRFQTLGCAVGDGEYVVRKKGVNPFCNQFPQRKETLPLSLSLNIYIYTQTGNIFLSY